MTEESLVPEPVENHHNINDTDADFGDSQAASSDERLMLHLHERRIQALELEIDQLKEALQQMPEVHAKQQESVTQRMMQFDGVQRRLEEMTRSYAESNRAVQSIEKRVDGVKKYATSGVVASILAFSLMLVYVLMISS